jgi:toxin CcdB
VARFDLYAPAAQVYVLDVQADLLTDFGRRVVVPLLPPLRIPKPTRDLHPKLHVDDRPLLMATHLIASMRRVELGRARGNLTHYRDEITRALDMLLTGF